MPLPVGWESGEVVRDAVGLLAVAESAPKTTDGPSSLLDAASGGGSTRLDTRGGDANNH